MITHIALLSPAENVPVDEFEAVLAGASEFADEVDGIIDIHFGADTIQESMGNGYTHALVITFTDLAARDAFLVHPVHDAYAARLGPVLSQAAIVDIEKPDTMTA
jgi:hypothetical protein